MAAASLAASLRPIQMASFLKFRAQTLIPKMQLPRRNGYFALDGKEEMAHTERCDPKSLCPYQKGVKSKRV